MFALFKARLWTFIPLIALYFAIVWAGQTISSLHTTIYGTQVYGTVRAVARCHNSNATPDGTVELTVAFRDAHGTQRVFRETSCYPYRFGVAHRLTVRYLTADPHQVATQNDLDRLAQRVLWLVGLLMAAALCFGALLFAAASDLRLIGRRGAVSRVASVAQVVAGSLIGLGAIGVIVCYLIFINVSARADDNLGDPTQTATVTARVIGVTACDYNPGGGDAISGVLARLEQASRAGEQRHAANSNGEQPTVSFVDRSGLTQQMELDECDPLYRVGMQVQVTYLLTDPSRHYDDGPNSNGPNPMGDSCLFTVEFIIVGAIVLGILRLLVSQRADAVARRVRPVARRRAW